MKNVTIPTSLLSQLIDCVEIRHDQWHAARHNTGHSDTVAELRVVNEREHAGMTRIIETCIKETKDFLAHSTDNISIVWTLEDVYAVRDDLDSNQAREVLKYLYREHDANTGINWEVIEFAADALFPGE